ncbi:MAG: excinuclease ABC subunit UvrA, partial [Chthoniobacterales bacterium]|nr:excinuclease ABC subunit UvrA [Chthoniobacterales bacterium]
MKSPENHSSSQATAPTGDFIRIRGARQHNLQNLNLDLPRNRLIVITGPSGSGKSSLAFDTLFAEGQRKYLESLSVQARQFLERLPRADVDQISGLPPSIAIAQESLAGNPRSTVATITEIYDYLRVLFSITGRPYDPLTGEPLRRLTVSEIVNEIKKSPQKSKIWILATIARDSPPPHNPILSRLKREGFLRARINRTLLELDDPKAIAKFQSVPVTIEVVVDRLILQGDLTARLTDSIELALRLGKGQLTALFWQEEFHAQPTEKIFSTDYRNPQTGYRLPQFTPRHFSYNSLEGACPSCSGLGYIEAPDVELILDPELSFSQGAFRFLKALPPTIQKTLQIRIAKIIENLGFPQTTPIKSLPPDVLQTLLYRKKSSLLPEFEGILPFLDRLHRQAESSQLRRKLKSFFSRQVCPECSGARLRPEPLCVFLETSLGKRFNISQFCKLNVAEALSAAKSLIIDKNIEKLASEIVSEIASRLEFLSYAGLSYLGLDRESSTLSGGEARRVRLAAQLGASLSGVLYVLDEPSIGLHPRDHARLLDMLRRLRDSGNTIVVVEHDEQTIRSADYLIDMGPGAGPNGGKIV